MPTLIDKLCGVNGDAQVCIDGVWYIAKPCMPYYHLFNLSRFRDAWLVLTGRAVAAQFAEDYFK